MAKKYKVNQGFITQQLKDKTIIFSGERSIMFTLNETAAYIFNCIKRGLNEEKIADSIQSYYNVDSKTAKEDLDTCLEVLIKKKIISPKN